MRSVGVTRRRRRLAAAAALALAVAGHASAASAAAPTRYSLANGCYALQGPSGQVDRGRRSACGCRRRRSAATCSTAPTGPSSPPRATASVAPAPEPSPAADWRVKEAGDGTFTLSPASAERTHADGALRPGDRLRRLPRGRAERDRHAGQGHLPFGKVGGLVEGHMHWMTFEYLGGNFHCGRPWHPYGIPYALPDCSSIEGPQGAGGADPELPQLRQPRVAARHERLPEADRLGVRATSPTRAPTGAGSSAPGWAGCG